jgi:hypothetical protein
MLTIHQLGRIVDGYKMDFSLHQIVCGRNRKNIKLIESATNTAIYFPPPFSPAYAYCPPHAQRRDYEQIIITGESPQAIEAAKYKLHDNQVRIRLYVRDVQIPSAKIDSILLTRMDKVRKIVEVNGSYIMFPALGSRSTLVRVQGLESLHIERTIRELMALVSFLDHILGRGCILTGSTGGSVLHGHLVDHAAGRPSTSEPGRHQDYARRHLC